MTERFLTLAATVRVSCMHTILTETLTRRTLHRLRPLLTGRRAFQLGDAGHPRSTAVTCIMLDDLLLTPDGTTGRSIDVPMSATIMVESIDVDLDSDDIMRQVIDRYLAMLADQKTIRMHPKTGLRRDYLIAVYCDLTGFTYTMRPVEDNLVSATGIRQELGINSEQLIALMRDPDMPRPVVGDGIGFTLWGLQAIRELGRRKGWLPPLPPEGDTTP